MPRRIIGRTVSLQAEGTSRPASPPDEYSARLVKLIPAESIATYTALNGILGASPTNITPILDWFVFLIVLVGTPFYLKKADAQIGRRQLIISCIAFVAFSLAQGAVFQRQWVEYSPMYGALLVPIVVFVAPLIHKSSN